MTMLAAMLTSPVLRGGRSPIAGACWASCSMGACTTADPRSSTNPDFIDRLYIAQTSNPATPLCWDNFAGDLQVLNVDAGMAAQTTVRKAITTAGMEYYDFNIPAGATLLVSEPEMAFTSNSDITQASSPSRARACWPTQ